MPGEIDHGKIGHVEMHFTDSFQQLLMMELAKARGVEIAVNDLAAGEIHLCCTPREMRALLLDARPAEKVLHLLELESVAKALAVAGGRPSQELLDMAARVRSELGPLAALV